MKVITVTEARVVALFKSISVAPIASPRPCKSSHAKVDFTLGLGVYGFFLTISYKCTYLGSNDAEKNCKHTEEKGTGTQSQASHEVDNQKEKYW